ncbi:MAG: GTP pyrophosphokinase, (p)ppGpp synthetase I, partial [uncultured Solirubrobacteraceae bacterium]
RRLGPPPPARGPLRDVRRGGHQHPRGALHRLHADGPEPLRRRGGGHEGAQVDGQPPAQHRRRLRRLPRHARRGL